MTSLVRTVTYGLASLLGLTGLVVLSLKISLAPPLSDLLAIAGFLLLSGGVTLAIGLGIAYRGWPRWANSMRSRLLLTSTFTTLLAIANVGFTAVLTFISPHDLALLAGLMGFALERVTDLWLEYLKVLKKDFWLEIHLV